MAGVERELMSFQLETIGSSFAREVANLALWQSDRPETADALRAVFREHPLLIFRRQALEEGELLDFARMMGSPLPYDEANWQGRFREIVYLSNMRDADGTPVGGLANQELTWHTDQSWKATPITGNLIYAIVVPEHGGCTSWADLYGAYESLPNALRRIVDKGVGTFSYESRARHNAYKGDNVSREERIRATPDVKHNLVHAHPTTGRKALYIDPNTVTTIDGLPDDEAADILDQLLAYATRPENVYRHEWRRGDLVLWDNACLLHRRDAFPNAENRLVIRMILSLPEADHIVPPVVV